MKRIIAYISIILGFLITYIIYKDLGYILLHFIFFVIITIIISSIVVFIISIMLLIKNKFRIRSIFCILIQKAIIYVIATSIIVSAPCLLFPLTYHIFIAPFYSESIYDIPINVDIDVSVNDNNLVIVEHGVKVFLPDSKYEIIDKQLDVLTFISLSNNEDDYFWVRDDTEYDSKSNYVKLAKEVWENTSEHYLQLIEETEYQILKKIYSVTPNDIKLGIKIDELFFVDELLMNKDIICKNNYIPKYFFELNDKSGFLVMNDNYNGVLTNLYLGDKIYLIAFGKDVEFEEIEYILGNIELSD